MDDAFHLARSVKLIRKAAEKVSRLAFANAAGLKESTIRDLGNPGWNPRLSTLKACERAAKRLLARRRSSIRRPFHAADSGEGSGASSPRASGPSS